MNTRTSSYEDDYTPDELSKTILKVQRKSNSRTSCPVCNENTYVKPHKFGYIEVEMVELTDDGQGVPEELGAPYGAVYEGYDWDCPRCMIIFGKE